jgi:hypothetical protein
MNVLFFGYRSKEPSNLDRNNYFKRVAQTARELLELLDERDNVRTLANDTKIAGGLVGEGAGFQRLRDEIYFTVPEYWLPPGVVIATPIAPGGDTPAGLMRDEMEKQISLAPRAIAMILLVAEQAATFSIQGASTAGRKRDHHMDDLFTHLAGMFYATFAVHPSIGSDRSDPSQASLLWVESVLARLWERSAGIRIDTLTPAHPSAGDAVTRFRSLLERAYALAPVTKADYLADGWHKWKDQPDYLQWPRQLWYPYGCDTRDTAGVPKWLLDKPIKTPG